MDQVILPPAIIDPQVQLGFWWALGTTIIIFLLGVVVFFLRRMVKGQDDMAIAINKLTTKEAVNEVKIETHIKNDAVHCKGAECQSIKAVANGTSA